MLLEIDSLPKMKLAINMYKFSLSYSRFYASVLVPLGIFKMPEGLCCDYTFWDICTVNLHPLVTASLNPASIPQYIIPKMFLTLSTLTIQSFPKCCTNSGEIRKHFLPSCWRRNRRFLARGIFSPIWVSRDGGCYYYCLEEINTLIPSPTPQCYSSIWHTIPPAAAPSITPLPTVLCFTRLRKEYNSFSRTSQAGPHFCFRWGLPPGLCEVCVKGCQEGWGVQKYSSHCCSCCVWNN